MVPCGFCDTLDAEVTAHCPQCVEFLCEQCGNYHLIAKLYRGHEVKKLGACGLCLRQSQAVGHCSHPHCRTDICQQCEQAHRFRMRPYRGHEVILYGKGVGDGEVQPVEEEGGACGFCDVLNAEVTAHCPQCQEVLCETCANYHLIAKLYRGHEVKKLGVCRLCARPNPDNAAVGHCSQCGADVCQECATAHRYGMLPFRGHEVTLCGQEEGPPQPQPLVPEPVPNGNRVDLGRQASNDTGGSTTSTSTTRTPRRSASVGNGPVERSRLPPPNPNPIRSPNSPPRKRRTPPRLPSRSSKSSPIPTRSPQRKRRTPPRSPSPSLSSPDPLALAKSKRRKVLSRTPPQNRTSSSRKLNPPRPQKKRSAVACGSGSGGTPIAGRSGVRNTAKTKMEGKKGPTPKPKPSAASSSSSMAILQGEMRGRPINHLNLRFDDTSDTEHDDLCCICRDGGKLILCEGPGCLKVYHPKCHIPALLYDNDLPDDFICTMCKSKEDGLTAHLAGDSPANGGMSVDIFGFTKACKFLMEVFKLDVEVNVRVLVMELCLKKKEDKSPTRLFKIQKRLTHFDTVGFKDGAELIKELKCFVAECEKQNGVLKERKKRVSLSAARDKALRDFKKGFDSLVREYYPEYKEGEDDDGESSDDSLFRRAK